MLRVVDDRIRWSERDVIRMVEVLGADNAVDQWAPLVPSIIRMAERARVPLKQSAQRVLTEAWERYRWVREFKRSRDDAIPMNAMLNTAWKHQRADVEYMRLTDLPAYLLAHQPGVGKTLEAIAWAHTICEGKRILVIAPNSAKYQWRREIRRWTSKLGVRVPIRVVDGTVPEQVRQASVREGWVVAHWEALSHASEGLLKRAWDVVIADEAHNAQNKDTVRAQTLFLLEARHRMALTAHPFTNEPTELWSILHFLYPKTYTSYWRFFHQHVLAEPKEYGGYDVIGTRNAKVLRWELEPFTLRRTNASLGRKGVTRIVRHVELTARARREYEKLKRLLFVDLEGIGGQRNVLMVPNVLSRTTRLRQHLVDPGLLKSPIPSPKYSVVAEIMNEVDGPPVVFSAFKQALLRLQQYLEQKHGKRTALISGGMSTAKRERARLRFLAGKLDALLVVASAGGESLNLGKYGYVIDLDLPWHPRGVEQTEGRVNRPEEGTGKIVPTTVYHIVIKDSYEQRQEARLERKHETFSNVFNAAQLRSLFTD